MSFNLSDPCLWCIEGVAPDGVHDVLGPVYKLCRACLKVCPTCEGEALYPAAPTCLSCLLDRLAALGLSPLFCLGCSGVIDLVDLDTKPEVTPHGRH